MQNDLAAGNRLEAPWLAGGVVRMARAAGVPAPVNATIYAALKPYVNGTSSAGGRSMIRLLLTWVVNAVALIALPYVFAGIHVGELHDGAGRGAGARARSMR